MEHAQKYFASFICWQTAREVNTSSWTPAPKTKQKKSLFIFFKFVYLGI